MTVVVLAGGRGSRMKADKAALAVGGRTLLEHVLAQVNPYFDEVLVSLSPGQNAPPLPGARPSRSPGPAAHRPSRPLRIRLVHDETPGLGPIGGLLAGLKAARNEAVAVVACDMPDIPIPVLRSLARAAASAEIAVAVDPAGHYEPLFAVYKRPVVGRIEALLARGERSLLPLYDTCRTAVVRLDEALRLRNLNTPADYEAYLSENSRKDPGRIRARKGPRKR
jgi:molybdopterin-guanine dinucleotide biosynthesis protein A